MQKREGLRLGGFYGKMSYLGMFLMVVMTLGLVMAGDLMGRGVQAETVVTGSSGITATIANTGYSFRYPLKAMTAVLSWMCNLLQRER